MGGWCRRPAGCVCGSRVRAGAAAHQAPDCQLCEVRTRAKRGGGRRSLQPVHLAAGGAGHSPRRSRWRAAVVRRQARRGTAVALAAAAGLELCRDPRHGAKCQPGHRAGRQVQCRRTAGHVAAPAAGRWQRQHPAAPGHRAVIAGPGQGRPAGPPGGIFQPVFPDRFHADAFQHPARRERQLHLHRPIGARRQASVEGPGVGEPDPGQRRSEHPERFASGAGCVSQVLYPGHGRSGAALGDAAIRAVL